MPFDSRALVTQPNMANCLERVLYEIITDDRRTEPNPGWVGHLSKLVKCDHLNPNYVFTSQYALLKRCYGKPLLYLAIVFNRADIVELLLSREVGASPNCTREPYAFESLDDDPFKRTAIFQSLSMSSTEIFKMLLHAPIGCDGLAVDTFNCSLLWHAVNMAQTDKLIALLDSPYGSKLVNVADRCGLRPLHIAAINNDALAAELLLFGGALVDAAQYEGATALCVAAKRGAVYVAKTLLMHGANPNHTPMDKVLSELGPSCDMTLDYYRKNKATNNLLITPAALAIHSRPFRTTPDQICLTLATLLACGARIPRSLTLPSFLPDELVRQCRTPSSLQIQCALVIRRSLLAHGRGRSVKIVAYKALSGIIPPPLIGFIHFDFLNQLV